jgi:hypothetical protein
MTRSLCRAAALATLATLIAAPCAGAQGAIGNQGFGYPTGQLSSAALGSGGSNAEVDPNSPINPAAIALPGRYSLLLQFEPEFRTTRVGSIGSSNAVMRFPNFVASGRVGRLTISASFSTFLDRSWINAYDDSVFIGGQWEQSSVRTASNGAIGDSRLAVAYVAHPRVRLGLGAHGLTGENRIEFLRVFPDSSGLGGLAQSSVLNFTGRALSAGLVVNARRDLVLAASMRFGGEISAQLNGTAAGAASVPTRWGASASWLALPGATVNARYDRTSWRDLQGLGTSVFLFDASEVGVGVDLAGPTLGGGASVVRLGLRDRTLPFGVNGDRVSERSYSVGAGVPVARGRGQLDLAVQRAFRAAGPATERSWFFSVGIGIRP